jgi:hypothetical protein
VGIRGSGWAPLFLAAALIPAQEAGTGATPARLAFERFRQLEGTWKGESTKGWKEQLRFQAIAGGSAVVETSFEAHPGETMLTVFVLDGDRLRLTHYCVAKNQPRLEATSFEDQGREVTFTFLDGGNLPSRERGHMDKAVFRFEDSDHVTSRWTWYQEGKERWLEEIRLTRQR